MTMPGLRGRLAITSVGAAACLMLSAPAARAGTFAVQAAKPTVKSFTVSPSKLPATGGKVTLSATVARAKTCTFSSKPAVAGLPATVSCTSGKATKVVKLPADTGTTTQSYRLRALR